MVCDAAATGLVLMGGSVMTGMLAQNRFLVWQHLQNHGQGLIAGANARKRIIPQAMDARFNCGCTWQPACCSSPPPSGRWLVYRQARPGGSTNNYTAKPVRAGCTTSTLLIAAQAAPLRQRPDSPSKGHQQPSHHPRLTC